MMRSLWCRGQRSQQFRYLSSVSDTHTNPLLFIGNKYHQAESSATLDIFAPRNGEKIGRLANASKSDVDAAIKTAHDTFSNIWDVSTHSWQDPSRRAACLTSMASILSRDLQSFAELETLDCGKPVHESRADIQFCVDTLHYYAGVALSGALHDKPLEVSDKAFQASILHEPVGVVGCITPWNYPLMQAVLKIAPAIAAGCSIVVKPSPVASCTVARFGGVAAEAGAPSGILNVILGGPPNSNSGQYLIDHPLISKVSFTGSGRGGKAVLEASAAQLRPTALELGGKGAMIVFDAQNVDSVVDWAMLGIFYNCGQICSATSRLLLHSSVYEEVLNRLLYHTSRLVVGDPFDAATQVGPLVSKAQLDSVRAHVAAAERAGLQVAVGGSEPYAWASKELAGGYYFRPTVLTEVPHDSAAWRDEIFGPVLCVAKFETEQEAIQATNASEYGLANSVMTSDPKQAYRVARQLRSGIVWQNCSQVLFPATPFGGQKKSGFGRELGLVGLEEYLHNKTFLSADHGYHWGSYAKQG